MKPKVATVPEGKWQKCPACNGYGTQGGRTTPLVACHACGGECLIHVDTGCPPSRLKKVGN